MDADSLKAVAEDLQYLGGWGSDISDAEVRRGSAVLRRLLVEDAYGVAWRSIGLPKQPTVIAVDLEAMLGNEYEKVVFALAAGADFRGSQIALPHVNKGDKPLELTPPPAIRDDGYPYERLYTLTEYLASLSGVAEGNRFNRRDVIKYIANVKGGVHLSAKQRKQEEKLIARLSKIEKRILIHESDGLLLETVAIAQSLGRSEDANKFIGLVLSS